jgi:short-subunit dehydrogenase
MDFNGKSVVLTGATGGIGQAMAAALSQAGATLILVARDEDALLSLQGSLPGVHQIIPADLTSPEGRAGILSACDQGVDYVINNAGVSHFGLLEDFTKEDLHATFDINVLSPMLLIQMMLPALHKSEGVIVNVGSAFGSIGAAGFTSYSASKFALRGFTEALRRELADTAIKVHYLAPRAVDTPMNSPAVVAMNKELGNNVDSPQRVAAELMTMLDKGQARRFIGFPESFFARLNSIFPRVVDAAMIKQLPVIRRFALSAVQESG